MKLFTLLAASTSLVNAAVVTKCNADNCARAVTGTNNGLAFQTAAKKDCESFFKSTVYPATVTSTATSSIFPFSTTITQTTATVSQTVTVYPFTATSFSTTATYISTLYATYTLTESIEIVTQTTGTITLEQRAVGPTPITISPTKVPAYASACSGIVRYSSACSCFGATRAVTTMTTPISIVTQTITGTNTATSFVAATNIQTLSLTTTIISYVGYTTTDSATVTVSVTVTQTTSVAATATAASGSGYCGNGKRVNGIAAPCTTGPCRIFNFRIEGLTETIFEGPLRVGPRSVTTPSGGTHKCDGTNNGANPAPGAASIGGIDVAASLCSFSFDGTWSSQFDDFFITKIGSDDSNAGSNRYWGVLENFQFTPAGGCETAEYDGSDGLWAYDAFNKNYFLDVEPRTRTVAQGQTVSFKVVDGTNRGTAISGAIFDHQTSNANGDVLFTAPTTPGVYRYKAERSDSIRSPAVVITVI